VTVGPLAGLLAGLGLTLTAAAGPSGPGGLDVTITPLTARPGDVLLIRVTGAVPDVTAEWDGRPIPLSPAPGGLAALVGIDLDTKPGQILWRLTGREPGGDARALAAGSVAVRPFTFPTQSLTLPRAQVDLDASTLARVRAEQAEFRAALAASAEARLWQGPFRQPIDEGEPVGGFGFRRIINGQPRSPHTGFDWAAPRGTLVFAANAGRVALVAEHFFAGRLVVLDHGLRLFTLYFHLDEAHVAPGARVAARQRIGSVGATGRATGPHLHFGVVLDGARVDPLSLLAVPWPPEAVSD
jgi:hypothetical protein